MNKVFVFLMAALFMVALHAIQVEDNKFVFSEQDMARCRSESGCAVITKDRLDELQQAEARCGRNRT